MKRENRDNSCKCNRSKICGNEYKMRAAAALSLSLHAHKREGKRDFANRQRVYEKHAINRCDLSAAVQCVYLLSGRATSWHIQEYVRDKWHTSSSAGSCTMLRK